MELRGSKDDMVEILNCTEMEKYIHFFQQYHLPSQGGGIDICSRGLFCSKFDAEKLLLLFKAFLGIMCIFGVFSPKVNAIFHFYTI